MRALPTRRIASGALCAALLVGITGPAAMAAAPARERSHTASPDASLPGADALATKVRRLGALGSGITPVTDLLNAVLEADNGRLPAAEARKLGDAAKRALAEEIARNPAQRRAADTTSDALDALREAIDNLVQAVTADTVDEVLPTVTDLLADLIDRLTATLVDSSLPAPDEDESVSAPVTEVPAVTLPAITFPAITLPAITLPTVVPPTP
ncbi:hypothetical protein [Streptomyces sp. NPDC001843]|uniref:hypothetical protein n=1 Tax=Streptomyces sp. NPDC001843 TaxID=3364617 RepID=UPI0036BE6D52